MQILSLIGTFMKWHADSKFNRDIYEMAKSHKIFYLPNYNKNITPFVTVHSNVWKSAQISNLSCAHYFMRFIDEYLYDLDISPAKQTKNLFCFSGSL